MARDHELTLSALRQHANPLVRIAVGALEEVAGLDTRVATVGVRALNAMVDEAERLAGHATEFDAVPLILPEDGPVNREKTEQGSDVDTRIGWARTRLLDFVDGDSSAVVEALERNLDVLEDLDRRTARLDAAVRNLGSHPALS